MKTLLHTPLKSIDDAPFHQMLDELHHCVDWQRNDEAITSLFYLLSALAREDPASLTLDHLPCEGILSTRLKALPEGAVADLCAELCRTMHRHPEMEEERRVLSLIKDYVAVLAPEPPRALSRQELDRKITLQRRRNRSG